MKRAYIAFFEGKKAAFGKNLGQEQIDILFPTKNFLKHFSIKNLPDPFYS
jgi:hypothetical protein